jgi:dihydropyrimidinase
MTPSDFVRVTSTAAAQLFNIYPRKGIIAVGADADIIVLDPAVAHTISASSHHSRMDTNVYEGGPGCVCVCVCVCAGVVGVTWRCGSRRWPTSRSLLCTRACVHAGKHIQGKVTSTISRGRLVWHDGKLDVVAGSGRFVPLPPFGPLFDGLQRQGGSTVERLVGAFAARNGPTPVQRRSANRGGERRQQAAAAGSDDAGRGGEL